MAKANQAVSKAAEIARVNKQYDTIIKSLGDQADSCETLMPLLSDVFKLGQKLAKLYKQGFNAGIKHVKN